MIAALVIAAGRTGRKMGFAPQKKVGTISAIERAVTVLQRADISHICVVCADNQTEKLVARRNVVFLRSSSGAQMFDCIKQGLGYLRDQCDAALIVPVDLALCSVQTVRALAAARGSVCVPAYQGETGIPSCSGAIASIRCAPIRAPADWAARSIMRGWTGRSSRWTTPEFWKMCSARRRPGACRGRRSCRSCTWRLRSPCARSSRFSGRRRCSCCDLTQETGSLLAACRRVGVSYSKGRGMIAAAEAQLGGALLARQQGGASGGSSVVTARGAQLMAALPGLLLTPSRPAPGTCLAYLFPGGSITREKAPWVMQSETSPTLFFCFVEREPPAMRVRRKKLNLCVEKKNLQ